MSCGEPHETDCSEVLGRMWLFLDEECDAECRARLAQHLEECAPCLATYGVEGKLKALLARTCREHAPEHLRDRLRQQLRHAVVEQAHISVTSGPDGTQVEVRSTRIERRRI